LLIGSFVYKIKKELKFGNVLDFSKLSLRKKFCQKEVMLNKYFCGNMYQCVVKIIEKNGIFRIADLNEKGRPLEYAVKMIEIPQKFRMDNLVKAGKINEKMMNFLTEIIIQFHNRAPRNKKNFNLCSTKDFKQKN
jgi:aminoglycoside phosphotransferase family enzyme